MSLFSIFKDKLSKTSNILSFNIIDILKNKKISNIDSEIVLLPYQSIWITNKKI
jgi:hypothetical protein